MTKRKKSNDPLPLPSKLNPKSNPFSSTKASLSKPQIQHSNKPYQNPLSKPSVPPLDTISDPGSPSSKAKPTRPKRVVTRSTANSFNPSNSMIPRLSNPRSSLPRTPTPEITSTPLPNSYKTPSPKPNPKSNSKDAKPEVVPAASGLASPPKFFTPLINSQDLEEVDFSSQPLDPTSTLNAVPLPNLPESPEDISKNEFLTPRELSDLSEISEDDEDYLIEEEAAAEKNENEENIVKREGKTNEYLPVDLDEKEVLNGEGRNFSLKKMLDEIRRARDKAKGRERGVMFHERVLDGWVRLGERVEIENSSSRWLNRKVIIEKVDMEDIVSKLELLVGVHAEAMGTISDIAKKLEQSEREKAALAAQIEYLTVRVEEFSDVFINTHQHNHPPPILPLIISPPLMPKLRLLPRASFLPLITSPRMRKSEFPPHPLPLLLL